MNYSNIEQVIFNGSKDLIKDMMGKQQATVNDSKRFIGDLRAINFRKNSEDTFPSSTLKEWYQDHLMVIIQPYRQWGLRLDVSMRTINELWFNGKFSVSMYKGKDQFVHFLLALVTTHHWLDIASEDEKKSFLKRLRLELELKEVPNLIKMSDIRRDDNVAQYFDVVKLFSSVLSIIKQWFDKAGIDPTFIKDSILLNPNDESFNIGVQKNTPLNFMLDQISRSKGMARAIALEDVGNAIDGYLESYQTTLTTCHLFLNKAISNASLALFNRTFINQDYFKCINDHTVMIDNKSRTFKEIENLDPEVVKFLLGMIAYKDVKGLQNSFVNKSVDENSIDTIVLDGYRFLTVDLAIIDDKMFSKANNVIKLIANLINKHASKHDKMAAIRLFTLDNKMNYRVGLTNITNDDNNVVMPILVNLEDLTMVRSSNHLRLLRKSPFIDAVTSLPMKYSRFDLNALIDLAYSRMIKHFSMAVRNDDCRTQLPLLSILDKLKFVQDYSGKIYAIFEEKLGIDFSLHKGWSFASSLSIKGKSYSKVLYMDLGYCLFDKFEDYDDTLSQIKIPLSTIDPTITNEVLQSIDYTKHEAFSVNKESEDVVVDNYFRKRPDLIVPGLECLIKEFKKTKTSSNASVFIKQIIKFSLQHGIIDVNRLKSFDFMKNDKAKHHIDYFVTDNFLNDREIVLTNEDQILALSLFLSRIFSDDVAEHYNFSKYVMDSSSYLKLAIMTSMLTGIKGQKANDNISTINIKSKFKLPNEAVVSFEASFNMNPSSVSNLKSLIENDLGDITLEFITNQFSMNGVDIASYFYDIYKFNNFSQFLDQLKKAGVQTENSVYAKVAYWLLMEGSMTDIFSSDEFRNDEDLKNYTVEQLSNLIDANEFMNFMSSAKSGLQLIRTPYEIISDCNMLMTLMINLTQGFDVIDDAQDLFNIKKTTPLNILRR